MLMSKFNYLDLVEFENKSIALVAVIFLSDK